jgi:uncharacterized protein
VRTHSPLVLDVRELLEHPGSQRPIAFDAPGPAVRSGMSEVAGDIHLDLVLEAIDGGVLVRGDISGEYSAECRRCLNPVRRPFTFSGRELYRPPADVWEEGYVIKETTIDLEPMVLDAVGLGLPTDPVCRDDCKGLCPRCGADLNEGECACPEETTDIRWSALKDLGQNLKNG